MEEETKCLDASDHIWSVAGRSRTIALGRLSPLDQDGFLVLPQWRTSYEHYYDLQPQKTTLGE